MRALVIFAHPVEDSFSAALHRTVVDSLTQKGWEVDDCDLYKEDFNPVLSANERRGYHDYPENVEPVQDYVERLTGADALFLVFPVWIFGFPAILKGFFDRVCVPGVAFRLENGLVQPNLENIRKLVAVTTYGGTRMRAFLAGDPPRKVVGRSIRYYCRNASLEYLALYDMNRASHERRSRFLRHVANRIAVI